MTMAGIDEGKRQVSGKEARTNLLKTPGTGNSAQPNPIKPSKIALKYPKKRMLKALPAFITTGSGEVAKDKRRRIEPSEESGEKVTEGQSVAVDNLKEVEERARLAVLHGEKDTSKMVAHLIKGIWLGIEEEKIRQLKASHAVVISQLQVETKANLDEMAEEHDRLGRHLMLKGYSEEEVDAIKADTYAEEEDEEEAEAVGTVDGLDGISRQTVLDNQGDDVDLPEGGSEKAVREMSLRINDLESGLARERETSKALLSAQAELQVELHSSRSREDDILMCNREFAEQFDRMKDANENREDQYVKMHFKLVEVSQAVFDLTLQAEEKDVEINKGLKELAEVTERTEKLQCRVDALAVKGKCKNELEQMRQKLVKKDDEMRVALENLSASEAAAEHLKIALPAKDMEFREMQRRCNDLNKRVARLKAELAQAIARAKKVEARKLSGINRIEVKTPLVRGDVVSLSGRIRELESDISRIQGNVQKGNTNLRECQHKLDAALIREKVLEGEIKAKESLVKRKEELLKDIPARKELNPEIQRLRAWVVDLEAMYLAESAKYTKKLEENVIYHAKIDAEMTEQKNEYARLESRLEKVRAKFTVMVIPDASRFGLLKTIITYFAEEVKIF
ncbi:hypothetical protein GIB67_009483 [Kingdonia uniflora]|uniref:Uncharacterized protein n=1 Tax=Kingdonia uniflora TaxID=39325 RepID=A0A7J7N3F8_9MAGN|nr:hypothetical protein GIB67_009483 [Kingdonia uniflora]